MYNFFQLNAFSDRTWASVQLLSWTVAEPGVILICACLPATWPLLRQISWFRKMAGKSSRGTARLVSSQPGSRSVPWPGHSDNGQHSVFIPLQDVDDQIPSTGVASKMHASGMGLNTKGGLGIAGGINVTREFSVTGSQQNNRNNTGNEIHYNRIT